MHWYPGMKRWLENVLSSRMFYVNIQKMDALLVRNTYAVSYATADPACGRHIDGWIVARFLPVGADSIPSHE